MSSFRREMKKLISYCEGSEILYQQLDQKHPVISYHLLLCAEKLANGAALAIVELQESVRAHISLIYCSISEGGKVRLG